MKEEGQEKMRTSCGLDTRVIQRGLNPFWQGLALETHELLASTHDLAKEKAGKGQKALIAACGQSAGRGLRGKSFYSPAGTGLYFSLALPWEKKESPVLLTTMGALAAARSLEEILDIDIRIKWVNDLYLKDKKVAGILTERVYRPESSPFLVTGIGINLQPPKEGFPPDIRGRAGALTRDILDKNDLLIRIANHLADLIQKLPDLTYLDDYRARSLVLGKEVLLDDGRIITPLDISDRGGLLYEEEGRVKELDSGQVRLLEFPL